MDMIILLPMILASSLVIVAAIAFIAIKTAHKLNNILQAKELLLARNSYDEEDYKNKIFELDELKKDHLKLLEERSVAATERSEAMRQIEIIKDERNFAREALRRADVKVAEAEKNLELIKQKSHIMLDRMNDWEEQKKQSIRAASEAIMKAGSDMSSKLLDDHKRETEESRKIHNEKIQKTTENLTKQFTDVTKAVHSLKNISDNNSNQVETVMRALTNPQGVGQMAEVGLENSLKNMGLQIGQDFIMQYHIEAESGRGLRPDAVVFLPQNMVIIIDSKASKFLLELAQSEQNKDKLAIKEAEAKLAKTMNEHIRALSGRDYKNNFIKYRKNNVANVEIGHVFNVMYLPSESAIDKMRYIDKDFDRKLENSDIILAGPTSLAGLFSLAKMQILSAKRRKNEEKIIDSVGELMESVITAISHIDKVGNSIKSASDNFEKFTRSVNSRMLPRMHKLQNLGIKSTKNQRIPNNIASYDVRKIEQTINLEIVGNDEKQTKMLEDA